HARAAEHDAGGPGGAEDLPGGLALDSPVDQPVDRPVQQVAGNQRDDDQPDELERHVEQQVAPPVGAEPFGGVEGRGQGHRGSRPRWVARKDSWSADRSTARDTARPPCPTWVSARMRIGWLSGEAVVASCRAAAILRACIGSTRVSEPKTVNSTAG